MTPLADTDAERAVLGAILLNPQVMWEVLPIVDADDFYTEPNRLIFAAMSELAEDGQPIDVRTVTSLLQRDGNLDTIGGASYVGDTVSAVPTSANADVYAGHVVNASKNRKLQAVQVKLGAKLKTGIQDADALACEVQDWVRLACGGPGQQFTVIPSDLRNRHEEWLYHDEKDTAIGLQLGIPSLDACIGHGIDNELVVIAARPSVGKTTLMLNVAHYLASTGAPGLIVTLETETHKLMRRLQSIVCPDHQYARAVSNLGDSREKWDLRRRHKQTVYDLPLFFHDRERVIEKVYYLVKQACCIHPEIRWVAFDYLQLFDTERPIHREYEMLNHVLARICALRKDIDRTIFLLSQLRRIDSDGKHREPYLSDLRGTGRIEQDADIVLLLHDPKEGTTESEAADTGVLEVIVAKNRDGGRGVKLELEFRRSQTVICSPSGRDWMGQAEQETVRSN